MGRSQKLEQAIDYLVAVVMEMREADKGADTGLTLGELVNQSRAAWGMSLQELAKASGLSKAHLWEIEDARTFNPRTEAIAALAEALRLPPIQVLNAALMSQQVFGSSLKSRRPTPPDTGGETGDE